MNLQVAVCKLIWSTSFLFVLAIAMPTCAAPLTGAGLHLPIPSSNPAWPPGNSPLRVATTAGFTGTWSSPVQPNWVGTYNASGTIPSSTGIGFTSYDFTSLPLGYLPAGTFLVFGDVDNGSGSSERFDLTAYDSSGNLITTPWLDETYAVRGPGSGTSGTVLPNNMPAWSWDAPATPNTYVVDGSTTTGGVLSVAFALVNNQPLFAMDLDKAMDFNGFVLQAPTAVPEPSTLALSSLALLALWARRRR